MGGRCLEEISNEVFCLDLNTLELHKLASSLPIPLCAHASEIVDSNIYIYGGTNGIEFLSDIYIFSID